MFTQTGGKVPLRLCEQGASLSHAHQTKKVSRKSKSQQPLSQGPSPWFDGKEKHKKNTSGRGKGGKGLGKCVFNPSCNNTTYDLCRGGAKRHRKILRDNIQGITKPVTHPPHRLHLLYWSQQYLLGHSPYRSPWWREAYLRTYLRRDSWCSQRLPGKCGP
jgi:hypothetical protein